MIKSLPTQLVALTLDHGNRRNMRVLKRFLIALVVMIGTYSVVFHLLMLREDQEHTLLTGLYWTLTVMSTTGFGDITFHSDLGRAFSILVLLSGMIFMLILLPFIFIQFFYEPWMKAQLERRTPRGVDACVKGHLIGTSADVVTRTLIRRIESLQVDHVLLIPTAEEAQPLIDRGFRVAVGNLDDPETWRRAGVERASMVLVTGSDISNSAIAFAVREVTPSVTIVTTAQREATVDVLQLAGATHVLRLEHMMGEAFARRVLGGDSNAHVFGHVEGLLIAEAAAGGTPMIGKNLAELALRQQFGIAVAGVWQRGKFEPGRAETKVEDHTVLVLLGTKAQIAAYNEQFGKYSAESQPVLVLGGGRVGRATAKALARQGLDYRIVDRDPARLQADNKRHFVGDAAELEVLQGAGLETTQSVVITTHHDDVNVFLTLYCRKLRPDVQILARATAERNVAYLHRAGADCVLSNASMGSNAVLNLMRRGQSVLLAEGLDVFRVRVPKALRDRAISECEVREATGCSIVALRIDGTMQIVPSPEEKLKIGADMLLVGSMEAQEQFLAKYPDSVLEPGKD